MWRKEWPLSVTGRPAPAAWIAKFGQYQPLNWQSDVCFRKGIELDVSTLADRVGASAATVAPLIELIRRHVLAAEHIHSDDTSVRVSARTRTVIGRLWTYVRDDRSFGQPPLGRAPGLRC